MALREYQLANFKAFAGPETIPIRPITLIYGPNSSGKSSILQSLLLLKQTLEEADSSTSLLPKGKLVDLGNYREFVHRHEPNRKFSFKALFTLDGMEKTEPDWVSHLLNELGPKPVGLKVDFAYYDETRAVRVSSIAVFIGDETLLVHDFPGLEELRDDCAITKINRTHDFWRTWWSGMKQCIEDDLNDVQYIFYKRNLEEDPFADFLQDLKKYPFEKARKDLLMASGSALVDLQNFLPVSVKPLSRDSTIKGLKALTQAQPSPNSEDADLSEKQSTEDSSPFRVEIFPYSVGGGDPIKYDLDVSPITLHVCSAFRQLVEEMIYIGPLRTPPKRVYTFSGKLSEQVGQSGEMLPDVLFQNPELLERINTELVRFGLGYRLKVVSGDDDSDFRNVFVLRLVDKQTDVSVSIRDVGFGVSQVLPIIVQSLLSQNQTLLIEQPESQLHPAHQAELGDLFIQSALGEQKNTFILETHSEHLLLRILKRIRQTTEGKNDYVPPIRPEHVALLFVGGTKTGSTIQEIRIDERGRLLDPWPGGFFEESFKELF